MEHFISGSCKGVTCTIDECGLPAGHKVGEEIPHDDPHPDRHNLTSYVCCGHFKKIMGFGARNCPETIQKPLL